eukprot:1057182-Alexandrium_andersonii.AAC.1
MPEAFKIMAGSLACADQCYRVGACHVTVWWAFVWVFWCIVCALSGARLVDVLVACWVAILMDCRRTLG